MTAEDLSRNAGREANPPGSTFGGVARPDPFQILVAEHELVRARLRKAVELQAAEAPNRSLRNAVAALRASVQQHVAREDRALFPVCERLFGGREGAAAVLRDDHASIRRDLAGLARASRGDSLYGVLDRLRVNLEEHFSREERVLFPLMAALLSGTEATALARRLRCSSGR